MRKYLYFLLLFLLLACSFRNSDSLNNALENAGNNRKELEFVLEHYKNDSLKLKAAIFLIENMPYHYSQEEYFVLADTIKVRPDIALINSSEQVKKICDSLLMKGFRIEKKIVSDITSLKSNFIINNIDLAFHVWEKPWARDISFIDFCRYILPYRVQTEKVSNLRGELVQHFLPVLESENVSNPLEACIIINKKMKELIRYQNTGLPFYPTIEETYRSGISTCDGLCNLGAFIMRAVGIPISVDQTIWTKIDLGHSWCVVLNEGRFYSFGPGEDPPEVHARLLSEVGYRKPAKVYRLRFDPYDKIKENKDDNYVSYLKSSLLQDVTAEYLDKVVNITIDIDSNEDNNNKSNQVYLCVYNYYQWYPIAIGLRENDTCSFRNVVGDNIFIVSDSPNGVDFRYITPPFYMSKKGEIHKFLPDKIQKDQYVFRKNKNKLDQIHTLHYWDIENSRFLPLKFDSYTDTTQSYTQIPRNTLLWFTVSEKILNQRIFFLEDGKMRIY